MEKQIVTVISSQDGSNNQDITFAENWTPKAAIFIWNGNTSLDTFQEGYAFGCGFTDGTNQRCMFETSADNVTNSDSSGGMSNDGVIWGTFSTDVFNVNYKATFSQWITGASSGVRINWSDPPSSQFYLTVIFLGGSDLSAKVDTLQLTTSSGDKTYSSLTWQPELLIGLTSFGTVYNTLWNGAGLCIGAATDSSNQWCQLGTSGNGNNNATTRQSYSHTKISYLHSTTLNGYATLSSMTSTGFVLNVGDAYPNDIPFLFLALRGVHVSVGNATEPGSVTTQQITNNKNNEVVMILGNDIGTADTISNDNMQTVGVAVKDVGQACITFNDVNGSGTMVIASRHDTNQIYLNMTANATATSSTLDDEADLSAMASGNFTMNWTDVGQARPYRYLTLGTTPEPQQFQRTISETAISISSTLISKRKRPLSQTVSNSDSISKILDRERSLSDTLTNSDSITILRDYFRSLSDTLTNSDSIIRLKIFSRSLADTLTNSDSMVKLRDYFRSLSDTINNSDSIVSMRARAITDSISNSDSITDIVSYLRSISDTISNSDSLAIKIKISISDSISIIDSIVKKLKMSIINTITSSDSIDRVFIPGGTPQQFFRSVSDTITNSEVLTKTKIFIRKIFE